MENYEDQLKQWFAHEINIVDVAIVHVLLSWHMLVLFESSSSYLSPGKLVKPPDLGLLPSDSELFPWRILMPHLHLGIIKGNRSLAL